MTMEKNNDKKLVKVVIESYAIRNEDGTEKFRLTSRKGAEKELNSLHEYYERHSLPSKLYITTERAIVECEVVRKRYPRSFPNTEMAGKTYYRLYYERDGELIKELPNEPKPLDVINAYAPRVNWIIIE